MGWICIDLNDPLSFRQGDIAVSDVDNKKAMPIATARCRSSMNKGGG